MNKAQTVLTSRVMNKKACNEKKVARVNRHHMRALDKGYESQIPRSGVFYVNIGGISVPTL